MTQTLAAPPSERRGTESMKIIVADDERDTREFLQELLTRLGHQVAVAENGRQLVTLCRQFPPDLVISDIRMPDADGIEASMAVNVERETPFVLITGHHEAGVLERATVDHVMAYLVKPVKPADVETAIVMAMSRFRQYLLIRKEARDAKQALEDRKVTERAKGVVMRRLRVEEEDAFRRMRKYASDHNRKAVDVAAQIVASEQIFHDLEAL
jgi:AmiR/NasT family two-component response regulator